MHRHLCDDRWRQALDGRLPPHPSAYYHSDDPNYVAFDDRGGTHRRNPNTIGVTNFAMTVLDNPVAKGITITGALVDNRMNTSGEGGPILASACSGSATHRSEATSWCIDAESICQELSR